MSPSPPAPHRPPRSSTKSSLLQGACSAPVRTSLCSSSPSTLQVPLPHLPPLQQVPPLPQQQQHLAHPEAVELLYLLSSHSLYHGGLHLPASVTHACTSCPLRLMRESCGKTSSLAGTAAGCRMYLRAHRRGATVRRAELPP